MSKKIFLIACGSIIGVALAVAFLVMTSEQDNSPQEMKATTVVPVATDSANTEASVVPQEVTITSQMLAKNYFVYEKSEYEKAKVAKRPIFLFFYANWCPTCAAQEPVVIETFSSLDTSNVIGFRINYNDSDTSGDERLIANEFGVRYQHTMFILDKNGNQTEKYLGQTSTTTFKEAFSKVE